MVDNGGIHRLEEAKGQIYLKAGIYPIKVRYFQAGGSYGMDLSWAPWNQNLKRLPSYLLLSQFTHYRDYKAGQKLKYFLLFLKLTWLGIFVYFIGFLMYKRIFPYKVYLQLFPEIGKSREDVHSERNGVGNSSFLSYLPSLILPGLVFFRYSYVLNGCFGMDDYVYLFDLHWMNLIEYISTSLGGHFYPLFKLEVLGLYKLFGYNSRSFFETLLVIHSINSILLYWILRKMNIHELLAISFSGLWATSAVFFRGLEWFAAFGGITFSVLFFLLALLAAMKAFDSDTVSLKYYVLGLELALSPIFFISNYISAILVFPLAWSLRPDYEKISWALFPLIPTSTIALTETYLNHLSGLMDGKLILTYFPQVLLYLASNGWAGLLGFPEHSILAGIVIICAFLIGIWILPSSRIIQFRMIVLFVAITCFYFLIHVGRTTMQMNFSGFNIEAASKALSAYDRYHYFPSLLIAISLALFIEQLRLVLIHKKVSKRIITGGVIVLFTSSFLANTGIVKTSIMTTLCTMVHGINEDFISLVRSKGIDKVLYFYNRSEPINAFVGKNEYPGLAAKFWVMRHKVGTDYDIRFVESDTDIITYWQEVYPEFGKLLVTKPPENVEVISLLF